MTLPLLATKLFTPPVRAGQVQRERLLARLDDALRPGVSLIVISAPAGFGKTSLLAEWLARPGKTAAWLSLDAGDNAPGLFLAYLMSAVNRVRPGLLSETQALLQADPPPPLETILAVMVNELSAAGPGALDPNRPLVLALDDFQYAASPEIRTIVGFLAEHLPPGARLAIATRSDPALPLARMRARGQMVELRSADLRFTTGEAAEFLSEVMGLRLDPETLEQIVETLTARTEGWIAGLQMAALALQSSTKADSIDFVRTFTGSHRFVLDYLAEEVLARLPQETVDFLLKSAVLDRFCASLCAAVIGSQPAARDACQQVLEDLDRSNLFLIPLDTERTWFRFHHLFADLLQARLRQVQGDQIPALHRRAADWFAQNGFVAEAIQHWVAAGAAAAGGPAAAAGLASASEGDYQHAAQLVEENTVALFQRGELHNLERWISLLPAGLADRRPWLCIYRAWVMIFSGRMGGIEALLQKAQAHQELLAENEQLELEGHCAAIRCHRAVVAPTAHTGEADLFSLGRQAKEKLVNNAWALGVVDWTLAFAIRAQGDLERAAQILEAILPPSRMRGDPWGTAMMVTDLGVARRLQGRLREAMGIYRSGLEFIDSRGARRLGYTGRMLTGMAAVLYEQNQLQEALQYLQEAVELNQRWRNPNHLVFSYLNLTRVQIALGNFEEAAELIEKAGQVLREMPILASLEQSLESLRLGLRLAKGQIPAPTGELETQIQAALTGAGTQQILSEPQGIHWLLMARILLAQQRPVEALRLLDALESYARNKGRGTELAETLTLKALACYQQGASAQALAALEEAAGWTDAEGVMRAILDTAPLVPGGLPALLSALERKTPALHGAIHSLLDALPEAPAAVPEQGEAARRAHPALTLVEPLSEREKEVLGLLAEGMTNAQIAARLVITTGTVKAHTANIFRKLDAANRTQAVSIAREAGLV